MVCTHVRFDHVGWNIALARGERRPVFERAEYVFGQREWSAVRDADTDTVLLSPVATGVEKHADHRGIPAGDEIPARADSDLQVPEQTMAMEGWLSADLYIQGLRMAGSAQPGPGSSASCTRSGATTRIASCRDP